MEPHAPLCSPPRSADHCAGITITLSLALAGLALSTPCSLAAEPSASAEEVVLRPGKEEYWSSVQPVAGDEGLRRGGEWEETVYRQSYPFDRHRAAPLRAEFEPAPASGPRRACVVNQFAEAFAGCRLDWVLPRGEYEVAGAEPGSAWDSDDGRWTVLTLRLDVPAEGRVEITASLR